LLKKQMGKYFDSLAYEYTMRQAVKDKYLCPIKAQMIPLELNIRSVGVSEGDYRADDISCALEPYLEQIADEMLTYCKGRKTVVFLPLVATSQKFCEMLKRRGFRAAEVNGESPDRAQILEDFDNGHYDVLTNSMLLTEGWDCPSVDCIINLRPTKVRSLYQQIIGRGLRLHPGKEYLLVLDFLWLTERHDLCRPSSIVCKDAEEAAKIDRMVEENPAAVDLMEAEEQASKDAIAERERSLAQQLAEMRSRSRRLVDPLQFALSIAAEDLADYTPTFAWEMSPPTQKQLDFLEKRGIYAASVENMGKASMLIDRLMQRQNEGLSTPKQIRLLERYGFRYVGTWSFDAASRIISRLAALNWKLPHGFNPATYMPG
ncbi:MAG: DEAD/DEAH box helicase, partial [Clostridia bacterium]|nr:DEAD/DEAH box helicase [Clostridia bacterium]